VTTPAVFDGAGFISWENFLVTLQDALLEFWEAM
jgi:hypothetical protein